MGRAGELELGGRAETVMNEKDKHGTCDRGRFGGVLTSVVPSNMSSMDVEGGAPKAVTADGVGDDGRGAPVSLPAELTSDVAAVGRIESVEKILEVICRTTGMGFSAVARVTDTRWVACAVRDEVGFGLRPGSELTLETTICDEIRKSGQGVVIDHVAEDARYCTHHTPRIYGLQSYISIPIVLEDGRFFGTLCAIDARPAKVNTPAIVNMFKLFAELIAHHLADQERSVRVEAALVDERETAQLREQFIAVLGHDLRNPLAAMTAGINLLRDGAGKEPGPNGEPDEERILNLMHRAARRMSALVSDVLDLARGRLGGGLPVKPMVASNLAEFLQEVVAEHRMGTGEKDGAEGSRTCEIVCDIRITRPVRVDHARLAQLLSNLISNAMEHGEPGEAVRVRACTPGDVFELTVTNRARGGRVIPTDVRERMFRPFERGEGKENGKSGGTSWRLGGGLGLGLYIATEIAKAHGGTLLVESCGEQGETCFMFRMPVGDACRPGEAG
jgi:signal transduction histidine kinase